MKVGANLAPIAPFAHTFGLKKSAFALRVKSLAEGLALV